MVAGLVAYFMRFTEPKFSDVLVISCDWHPDVSFPPYFSKIYIFTSLNQNILFRTLFWNSLASISSQSIKKDKFRVYQIIWYKNGGNYEACGRYFLHTCHDFSCTADIIVNSSRNAEMEEGRSGLVNLLALSYSAWISWNPWSYIRAFYNIYTRG
jgi:hypothetical protein